MSQSAGLGGEPRSGAGLDCSARHLAVARILQEARRAARVVLGCDVLPDGSDFTRPAPPPILSQDPRLGRAGESEPYHGEG